MNSQEVELIGTKILVVDDTPGNIDLMRSILEPEGYRLFAAPNGEAALKVSQRIHPQLILLDVMMTGIDGFETCRRLKSFPELEDIPVIFVTARSDTEDLVKGFEVGGVDYISKPIRQEEVIARVRTHLQTMILFDIQRRLSDELTIKNRELKKAYNELEEISLTDPLTGMKNRRFLAKPMDADTNFTIREYYKWQEGESNDLPLESDIAFFLLDLDYFKRINDTFGHASGDRVLIQVRELLEKIFRKSDYLVRWGGEEFLVVARFINRDQAPIIAERIRQLIKSHEFCIGNEERLSCTCSIGYSIFPFCPHNPDLLTWSQVIELADTGLYIAKNSSRNAWVGLENLDCDPNEDFFPSLISSPNEFYKQKKIRVVHSFTNESLLKWK